MLKILFSSFLILLSGSVFAQGSKADAIFDQANEQVDKGDAKKAIRGYLNAREEYLKEENYKRVLTCTQNVANYYQETGDGKEAEKVILETIKKIPSNTPEQLSAIATLYDNLAYLYLILLDNPEDAINAYTTSIGLYEKAGKANTANYAFELVNRAVTYHQLSQFQSSANDMEKAISIYKKDPKTKAEELAELHHTLGTSYIELAEFDKAITIFERGIALIQTSENDKLKAKFYNDIGIVNQKRGNFQSALEKFEQAKKINESVFGKNAENYAKNLINIGSVHKSMGDLETSLAHYQEVLAIYQKTPPTETVDVIDLFLSIQMITDDIGKYEESKIILAQAMALATQTYGANSIVEADVYLSMAATALNHSEYDESLQYNFKALSILEANKYPMNETYAVIYSNIAAAYDELNDLELALKFNKQALDIYTKIYGSNHISVAMANSNIGLSYEIVGEYDKALDQLKLALAIRQKIQAPNHENIGTLYLNMGLVHLKKGETKLSLEYLEKARAIYDHYEKNINKAMIYNRLAFGYFYLNDLPKASSYLQQAIISNSYNFENTNFDSFPDKHDFLDYYETVISYTAKTDWYVKKGDSASLAQAVKQLDAADKILKEKALHLNNAKDRLELAQINAFFTESGLQLAQKFYEVSKDPIHLEKAFYYSERSKANELLADIQVSKARSLSRIPRKTVERRKDIVGRMATLQVQIAAAYTTQNQPLMTRLKAQEFDLTREYETIHKEMVKASPKLSAVLDDRTLPPWNEVKKLLGANTAMVSYIITDSAKFVLIGSSTKLILKQLDKKTDLEKLVRGYSNQIKFQGPALEQIAHQLTDILWTPVEAALKALGDIKKIIIVPEGPLNYLPFESLGHNSYLIEKYIIQYQLSGAMMVNTDTKPVSTKPTLIALAPVFSDNETNFINKSCERFVRSAKRADTTSRAFSLNGEYIAPLPATETEVEKINQIHADKGIFAKSFVREAANEELIKKGELEKYDFIHFATHGFVNSQYPEMSGLLLAQNRNSPEDGVLYSGEILGLTLKADLVTLSACETALGKKFEGEGVRGLTTAFLFAGAKSVVASLWKVADESTSMMMIYFYTELLAGKDKASALRQAKLNLMANERYKHPYYWAPFIQIGEN